MPENLKFQIGYNGHLIPDEEARQFVESLQPGSVVELEYPDRTTGSQSMLNTWMLWMEETAKAMRHYGCTMPLYLDKNGNPKGSRPFEQRDAHSLFTARYLGTDDQGRRKTWKRTTQSEDEIQASKGDRLWAMQCHEAWATDKGIQLTIPRNSEYSEMKREQGE